MAILPFLMTSLASASRFQSQGTPWIILINTSAWYINYRHAANTQYFAKRVKEWGVPDENIIHIQAQDVACDPRNPLPGYLAINKSSHDDIFRQNNLITSATAVDYRGADIQVEAMLRLLSGKYMPGASPRQKVLRPSPDDPVFVYLTGHGGDHFIKLRDWYDLEGEDLGRAFEELHARHGFDRLLWIADSCEISTLQDYFTSPDTYAIGSSRIEQSAWSHNYHPPLNNSLTDIWTWNAAGFLDDLPSPCGPTNDSRSTTSTSIQGFHDEVAMRSRNMGDQDALLSVTPDTRLKASDVPLVTFLSHCPRAPTLGRGLRRLEDTEPLARAPIWEVPPVIPNSITTKAGGIRAPSRIPVPGRFAAVGRLGRTDALYTNFQKSAVHVREEIARAAEGMFPTRFPTDFPSVKSNYVHPETQMHRVVVERLASQWTTPRRVLELSCEVAMLLSVFCILVLRLFK